MSSDAASFPCPLCLRIGVFNTVQSLRDKLICVSTSEIPCPVCQEKVVGLDKLTIHLFSHVKTISIQNNCNINGKGEEKESMISENQSNTETLQKKKICKVSKNKPSSTPFAVTAPIKFVKIYPKIPVISLNTIPVIDISQGQQLEKTTQSTVCLPTVKAESSIIQTTITCNVCGLQFASENILQMHKCIIHNNDENSNRHHCHLCSKIFKMRGSLMVHLRVAHFGFKGNDSNDTESNTNCLQKSLQKEDKTHNCILEKNENKQWQCDVCRKCFTTKYFLKKHKRLHTGETPYSCTQCNKTFTFQQSYHKHLLYHNDEKPHTCSYCGRAFKELSTLHNHQRIHTGEKPFACETCGKCFRQRVSYLVHRRIHTGVMPYKCTACNKSFRYKVSQRTHKCQVQPPGTVIRQTGELLEKLKKKQTDYPTTCSDLFDKQNKILNFVYESNINVTSTFTEISEANAELVRRGAELSLEDMESENFTLISEPFTNNVPPNTGTSLGKEGTYYADTKTAKEAKVLNSIHELVHVSTDDNNVPSPSEILKNLCLSRDDNYIGILQNIDEEKDYDISDLNVYL